MGFASDSRALGERLISVRSVVQLYPGPCCYLITPRRVLISRGDHVCDLFLHAVRYAVRSWSGFDTLSSCECLSHGHRVRLLVAGEDSLCALPSSERTQILERHMLQLGRELPPKAARGKGS